MLEASKLRLAAVVSVVVVCLALDTAIVGCLLLLLLLLPLYFVFVLLLLRMFDCCWCDEEAVLAM